MLTHEQKKLRQHAKEIFWAGVSAVDPQNAVRRALQREGDLLTIGGEVFDLREYRRVFVIGAGKAAVAMARGVENCLGENIETGLVVTSARGNEELKHIRVLEAGHPIPDARGEHAAKQILP